MGIVARLLDRPRNEITTSSGLDAWIRQGTAVWSGVSVTPQNALEVSAVFACVRVIAEDIGKLPFVVYQQVDGERQRATTSPYWRLIHDRPNSVQTSQQFREYLTASALLRGNGVALPNRVGGQVRELVPIHPDRVRIEETDDWDLIFWIRTRDGRQEVPFRRRDVFHLPGLTVGGLAGVSVIQYARQSIGTAMGAERYAGTYFANGMQPSGVYKHPGQLSKEAIERIKESLDTQYQGENAHKTLILEEGMDWTPISLSNEDSQFIESRQFSVVEVCRWFRVAPHKIAELSRATFSNIEHQAIEHVTDTLMPWAERWEAAVNQQVIATNAITAEILFDALLRGTTKDRYEAYQLAAGGNAPWMSRNEIRRLENLGAVEGLDDILTPLNMSSGDGAENNEPDS